MQAAAAETVLPATQRRIPRATHILDAGATGLLLAQEGDDRLLWIDYATGVGTALATRLASKPVYNVDSRYFEQAPFSFEPGYYGRGSDTVALYSAVPAPHVTFQKGAGAVFADIAVPAGQTYKGTFGDTVVTVTGDPNAPTGYHLLKAGAGGGKATDTPVTGLLDGAASRQIVDGDAKSVIVRSTLPVPSGTESRWTMVDLATGQAKGLPDRPDPDASWEISGFSLAPQGLLRIHGGRSLVDVMDRANPEAAPLKTVETSVLGQPEYALLGGTTLLGVDDFINDDRTGSTLWRFPESNEYHLALGSARRQLVTAPDGSVLVVGSVAESSMSHGDVDWAVHRLTQSAAGATEVKRVAAIAPLPAAVYGLALGSGILNTSDNSTVYEPSTIIGTFRTARLSTGPGTPAVVSNTVDRSTGGRDGDCWSWDSKRCVAMFSAGDGNHGRRQATEDGRTVLYESGSTGWGPQATTGDSNPALTDLSGRFAIVEGLSSGYQYVTELKEPGSGATLIKRDRVASAVWGSTLWSGSTTDGTVKRQSLPGGAAQSVFKTLDDCVPNQLQAVGRWVYWACPQAWDPGKPAAAGLFDQTSGKSVAVPTGSALLGDGYLVRRTETTGLELTDLSGGVPAAGKTLPTRVLVNKAKLGASIGRRTGWTVDRFGGHVAYVDDEERVHVLQTGVAASPLTRIDAVAPAAVLDLRKVPAQTWTGKWWLSKPAASWTLKVRDRATGVLTVVRRGGEARGLIAPTWDGKDAFGKLLYSGAYDWALTAKPADGLGADLIVSGTVSLSGARARPPRDHVGDGNGDLFGLKADGTAEFRPGGGGAFGAAVSGSGWTGANAVNAVVPFGDVDEDGCNDVLVRTAAGELRAYRPGCGNPLKTASPYAVVGVSGWNVYDTLTSPGDITGDGRADLLAKNDATGQLFLYALKGAGLGAKVLVAEGLKGYQLTGARDLDGDGDGDLLGRDPAGKLWFYAGGPDGKLAAPVQIGTGWHVFNALIGVGDITGDGKADLVARDKSGALWRYAGRGNGRFEARVKISDGWGAYASLS